LAATSRQDFGGAIFSNRGLEGKWFPLSATLPTMSARLGVERLEAKGLVGTARSSPQPPLAVARRARLEVAVPIGQHWTKRAMSSVWVLTDCGCLTAAGSIVLFAVH
jgi:hypothetical protein